MLNSVCLSGVSLNLAGSFRLLHRTIWARRCTTRGRPGTSAAAGLVLPRSTVAAQIPETQLVKFRKFV